MGHDGLRRGEIAPPAGLIHGGAILRQPGPVMSCRDDGPDSRPTGRPRMAALRAGPPPPRPAKGDRRPSIHGAKRGVEAADAPEPCRERDRRHRHRGLVDQSLRPLDAPGRRDGPRRGTSVPHEQATEISARHPERVGELLDGPAVVEEAAFDEAQGARDGRRGAMPRRCPRCGLGPTPQARTKARTLGRGRGGKEGDVARLGRLHRTRGTAIDPRGQHASEEAPVESPVPRDPRAIACPRVERDGPAHGAPSLPRQPPPAGAGRTMASESGETGANPAASIRP